MPQFNRRISQRTKIAFVIASLACAPSLAAQHAGAAASSPTVAPKEGAQFDFLIGQWEVVAKPVAKTLGQRIHGVQKLPGVWKAWRALDGWGIEDELRLTDASGNPRLLTHTIRYFDSSARKWNLSAIDVYKGIVSASAAELKGKQMLVTGQGKEADGGAYLSRGTFTNITAQTFAYRLDRSYDGGKTWTEGLTTIDAKRTAATAPR